MIYYNRVKLFHVHVLCVWSFTKNKDPIADYCKETKNVPIIINHYSGKLAYNI